jgi:ribosomal protein S12 methylthiotransferase accessory factor
MEEVEKWAQEEFARTRQAEADAVSSFAKLRDAGRRVLDPALLDLPYDSCYTPELEIDWHLCADLASGGSLLVPTAAITHRRVPNDIYYSPYGGRKTVTTNGLASGMAMAEALTHALCEYIERHARALDSIAIANPGGPGALLRPFLNLNTAPRSTRTLVGKITRAGHRIVVQDITSDVAVPTFTATILLSEGSPEGRLFSDGWQRASGWAAHPDPETALNMAILEASQTILTHIAGAREDLVLQARSLGRHDRTESRRRAPLVAELDADAPRRSFTAVRGFTSNDAAEDVRWILRQIRKAGWKHALIIDYSCEKIKPARVVRAIIPRLETINPFYTGTRARAALLSDLLPHLPV